MIELGDHVVDSVSQFKGIAMARTEYLYGCVRVMVSPTGLDEKGKPFEEEWFDEGRLGSTTGTGGPERLKPSRMPDAPR